MAMARAQRALVVEREGRWNLDSSADSESVTKKDIRFPDLAVSNIGGWGRPPPSGLRPWSELPFSTNSINKTFFSELIDFMWTAMVVSPHK